MYAKTSLESFQNKRKGSFNENQQVSYQYYDKIG